MSDMVSGFTAYIAAVIRRLRALWPRCLTKGRLDKTATVKTPCATVYNLEGWVGCARQEVLRRADLSGLLSDLRATEAHWSVSCDKAWFESLRFYPRFKLIEMALNKDIAVLQRRQLSACAILFDFKLPARLWLLDLQVITVVTRYHLLTARVPCVVDAPVGFAMWVKSTELAPLGKRLRASAVVLSVLALTKPAPNYWVLKALLTREGVVQTQDDALVKKALTACYARVGVWIPRDYLLIDDEVRCLVHRVGFYGAPKRAVLKVVT